MNVFVITSEVKLDGEFSSCIIGVYDNPDKAEEALKDDVDSIKEDWKDVVADFDNPEDWKVISDNPVKYTGCALKKDYSYSIEITLCEVK